jgi:phosphoribosylaminoimidazole (AIR) synthetase
MKRSKVIDNANNKAGDVIVGLASLGSQPMRKVIMVWVVTD